MFEIVVLFNPETLTHMHLRYNLWQMVNLYSFTGCVCIEGWVYTYNSTCSFRNKNLP